MLTSTILDSGMILLRDPTDGFEVAISADDWRQLQAFPAHTLRTELELLLLRKRADPTGGRTAIDEQTMETAQNAATGEAHQQDSEARGD
jgi:hypothetical protein